MSQRQHNSQSKQNHFRHRGCGTTHHWSKKDFQPLGSFIPSLKSVKSVLESIHWSRGTLKNKNHFLSSTVPNRNTACCGPNRWENGVVLKTAYPLYSKSFRMVSHFLGLRHLVVLDRKAVDPLAFHVRLHLFEKMHVISSLIRSAWAVLRYAYT